MASHNVGELVDQQVRRWMQAHDEAGQGAFQPCVTVSRQPASGGRELAQRVAQRLGYGFFGREIVDAIATEEGVSKTLVAGLDERAENAIERHLIDGFRHRSFTESDYLRDAVRIVSTLGLRGHTVILGRGSAQIIPEDKSLRVLVVAPPEWREKRMVELHGLSVGDAAERRTREDTERAEFWRRNFEVDYTDAALYDVAINMATLGVEAATDLIAQAFATRFPS